MEEIIQRLMRSAYLEIQKFYEEERHNYQTRIQFLENELQEMQRYKDVSLVNKLTIQVDQLQNENQQLRKRQRLQGSSEDSIRNGSVRSPAQVPALVPTPVQDHVRMPEPEPSLRSAPAPEPSMRSRAPAPEPEPSMRSRAPEPEPVSVPEPLLRSSSPAPERMAQETDEPTPELYQVDLKSGQYYWEPVSGHLYAKIGENMSSETPVGKIKTMRVRDKYYYQDTSDSNVYEYTASGDIGAHCGSIVNGKFVKN